MWIVSRTAHLRTMYRFYTEHVTYILLQTIAPQKLVVGVKVNIYTLYQHPAHVQHHKDVLGTKERW